MRVVNSRLPRYGIAIVTTALAALAALVLAPLSLRVPFALFAAAVLVSSLEGGLKPGLLATFLATVALSVEYWLLPLSQHAENQAEVGPLLMLFVFVGLLSNYLGQCCWRAVDAVAEQKNRDRKQCHPSFRALAACAPVGILQMDLRGRCIYANCTCQLLGGFSAEEGFGQGWARCVHAEDRDQVVPGWTRAMQEGKEFAQEFRFQLAAQDVHWVRLHATPIYSDQGKLIGHVGILQNITERKLLEEALGETHALLAALVDESAEPLAVKNRLLHMCQQITEEHQLRLELAKVTVALQRQIDARRHAEAVLQEHQEEQVTDVSRAVPLFPNEPLGSPLHTNGNGYCRNGKPEAVEVL